MDTTTIEKVTASTSGGGKTGRSTTEGNIEATVYAVAWWGQ